MSNFCGFMRAYSFHLYIFYEKTVKKLTEEEKNLYHRENMLSADLVLVNTNKMPKTHNELRDWVISKSREKKLPNY